MSSLKSKGVGIPSIDGKDLYLAKDYDLKTRNGDWNVRKFINTLDMSLDLLELKRICGKNFSFRIKNQNREYTTKVINVTFKYSVAEWNQVASGVYVKMGYNNRDLVYENNVARNSDGEIVGVATGKHKGDSIAGLPDRFEDVDGVITLKRNFRTVATADQIRQHLYEHGFYCGGVHYVRWKRSAGSARRGKVLFIDESLYQPMCDFAFGGIKFEEGDKIDLAAWEAYISLTSSSIIDLLPLSPENILVVEDYDSIFEDDVIATRDVDGKLSTSEEHCQITNSIWDGESLLDVSAFGDYRDKGMVLLRNIFFKSCCFNCNLQQYFADNGITDVGQLNGKTRAKTIDQIKMVTTPNSIKYLKFGTLDEWLDHLLPEFGIVKYEKTAHYFQGRCSVAHYQLLNTLQMSGDETREFLSDALSFAQLLKDRPEVVRYYIKYPNIEDVEPMQYPMVTKNDVVFNLMCINDRFTETRYYMDFQHDLLAAYYKQLKNGKVPIEGCYATLLGNPMEFLAQSIGRFDGSSHLGVDHVHTTRFAYGTTILGSRSPHISISNVWLPTNVADEQIDKYFNLTDQILCINSIGENCLQRLAGADFDSDSILITDNKLLINAASKNYSKFKIATCFVDSKKIKRSYTPQELAELDSVSAGSLIGEVVNLSQVLNSMVWDNLNNGGTYDDIKYIYYDICQLSVISGLAINSISRCA